MLDEAIAFHATPMVNAAGVVTRRGITGSD
jgi:hypothetical protein